MSLLAVKLNKISLFISFIFFISCSAKQQNTPSPLFNKEENFEIISSSSEITKHSSSADSSICKDWIIEDDAIIKIIKQSEPLSGEDWHHLFDVLPCIKTGELAQGKEKFKYEINAGSWIYIFCKDSTLLLGNYKKENEKYFLSPVETEGN